MAQGVRGAGWEHREKRGTLSMELIVEPLRIMGHFSSCLSGRDQRDAFGHCWGGSVEILSSAVNADARDGNYGV